MNRHITELVIIIAFASLPFITYAQFDTSQTEIPVLQASDLMHKKDTSEIEIITAGVINIITKEADQFGGLKGKKLDYESLKKILFENHQKSMHEQK